MTDNLGFGREKRRELNLEILSGKQTFRCVLVVTCYFIRSTCFSQFRDGFREMLASVVAKGHSFEECKQVLRESA
jgi:hypothetical protein